MGPSVDGVTITPDWRQQMAKMGEEWRNWLAVNTVITGAHQRIVCTDCIEILLLIKEKYMFYLHDCY